MDTAPKVKLEVYGAVRKSEHRGEFLDMETIASTRDGAALKAFEKEERCKVDPRMNKNFAQEFPVVRIAYFAVKEK